MKPNEISGLVVLCSGLPAGHAASGQAEFFGRIRSKERPATAPWSVFSRSGIPWYSGISLDPAQSRCVSVFAAESLTFNYPPVPILLYLRDLEFPSTAM